MSLKNASDTRTRNWTFLVYPESAPDDWREKIDELHAPWVESPLHNLDVDDASGELKKAHWHIAIAFSGKKSFTQIKEITDSLNTTIPQPVNDMRGTVRYFAHLDHPYKHQYSISDIVGHSGFDLDSYLSPTSGEEMVILSQMCEYVSVAGIYEFADLVDYARESEPRWFRLLATSKTVFMKEYIKSRSFRDRSAYKKSSDIVPQATLALEDP